MNFTNLVWIPTYNLTHSKIKKTRLYSRVIPTHYEYGNKRKRWHYAHLKLDEVEVQSAHNLKRKEKGRRSHSDIGNRVPVTVLQYTKRRNKFTTDSQDPWTHSDRRLSLQPRGFQICDVISSSHSNAHEMSAHQYRRPVHLCTQTSRPKIQRGK